MNKNTHIELNPSNKGKKQKLRRDKKRKLSSTNWISRQLNDPYVLEANRLGYNSRSAFKLIEIDARFNFLKPRKKVVDLGCAPGGWLQVIIDRCQIANGEGKLIGVDLLETKPLNEAKLFIGDFSDSIIFNSIVKEVNYKCDLVLSDMAASTTGHRKTDHLRTAGLFELAFDFAQKVLVNDGVFVAKIFRGLSDKKLDQMVKEKFMKVRFVKPDASRNESVETYMLATGFKK